MKRLLKPLLLVTVMVSFFLSCNRNAEVVRQLHYYDLLNPENSNFFSYPNEFSSYLLRGVLEGVLEGYYIDYDSSGHITRLDKTTLTNNILDPYEYYEDEPEYEEEGMQEDPGTYLSYITLLSFDNLLSDGEEFTQFINFYHPSDVTPEGINRYIGSVKYESALEYLSEATPAILWHNYKLEEWGWFKEHIFVSDLATSSRLAVDMIELSDSSLLKSKISDSLTVNEIKYLAAENPFSFSSKINSSENYKIDILYRNDSLTFEIASFTFKDLENISEKKKKTDSVIIVPVATAILDNKLKMERVKRVSRNGSFEKPLRGEDELSKRKPDGSNVTETFFPASQKYYFRSVERLIGGSYTNLEVLPGFLYQGVKNGLITAYQNDSLRNRLLPGEFFNNMILDVDDNIIADTKSLIVYTVIRETIFEQNGKIGKEIPIGIGIYLPGKYVPEGFNRQIGYFKIDEIEEYLKGSENEDLALNHLKGFPLSSWKIALYPE